MPKNLDPVHVKTGKCLPVHIAAANTATDGSGTLVTVGTSGADGSRVSGARITNAQASQAASSAMRVAFFLTDLAGANPRIIGEIALPVATRSATVIGASVSFRFDEPVIIEPNQLIRCCASVYAGVQDQICVQLFQADF